MWKDYKKQESDGHDGVCGSCADMEIMIMDYNGDNGFVDNSVWSN